jgi:hypothetical protein
MKRHWFSRVSLYGTSQSVTSGASGSSSATTELRQSRRTERNSRVVPPRLHDVVAAAIRTPPATADKLLPRGLHAPSSHRPAQVAAMKGRQGGTCGAGRGVNTAQRWTNAVSRSNDPRAFRRRDSDLFIFHAAPADDGRTCPSYGSSDYRPASRPETGSGAVVTPCRAPRALPGHPRQRTHARGRRAGSGPPKLLP